MKNPRCRGDGTGGHEAGPHEGDGPTTILAIVGPLAGRKGVNVVRMNVN